MNSQNDNQFAQAVDVRTRRPFRGQGPSWGEASGQKTDPQLEYTKSLYRELIKMPVYKRLKGLAYGMCIGHARPRNINEYIDWTFTSAARSFVDNFFNQIERLGRDVPPEELPVVDKARPSFFADNTDEI